MPRATALLIGVLDDGSQPQSFSIPANPKLALVQGEDADLKLSAYKADGSQLDMSGMTIFITVKAKTSDASPLISRAGTIDGDTATFQIGASDWLDGQGNWKLAGGTYLYDVWLVSQDARAPLVKPTQLTVVATVGDAGDVPTSYQTLFYLDSGAAVAAAQAAQAAAATSETNAAASATNAAASASGATSSASAATTSATNAASSASAAATSASASATSATSAAGSATTATTQATNANSSATAAANSASTATTQAAAAAASALAAAASAAAAAVPAGISNPNVVTADFTIPADVNTLSVGPLEIAQGVSVTIGDNSNWAIA